MTCFAITIGAMCGCADSGAARVLATFAGGKDFAVDHERVYVADWETDAIWSLSVDGGDATPLYVREPGDPTWPEEIQVHGQFVYYFASTAPNAAIVRAPTSGGPAEVQWELECAGTLATEADYVYWSDEYEDVLRRGSTTTLEVETLATTTDDPRLLVLSDSHVYWYDIRGEIWRVPKSGGDPAMIAASSEVVGVAVDAQHVYWSTSEGDLYRTAKDGSEEPALLASPQLFFNSWAAGPALDGDNVYWAVTDGDDTKVATVPKSGGEMAAVAFEAGEDILDFALVDDNIYWMADQVSAIGALPTVWKVNKNNRVEDDFRCPLCDD